MKLKKYIYIGLTLSLFLSATPIFAQNMMKNNQVKNNPGAGSMMGNKNGAGYKKDLSIKTIKPVATGIVLAVNGKIITINSKKYIGSDLVDTVFTVDATNAKIIKNNVAGTISDIVIEDTIVVQGVLNGTNIVATSIIDGYVPRGGMNTEKFETPKKGFFNRVGSFFLNLFGY